ncbi:MAG: xylulokinase [Cellvibrionaceae bacterium]|nr:xylulokinase [Cellvibrionaceae bacterium]
MYIGIDCGTQGTKVLILDAEKAQVLGEGYATHTLISDSNGRREQQPDEWIRALCRAYQQALKQSAIDSRAIKAMAVSGQQHGLVVLDKAGQVIRPAKLWCDTETAPQNAELLKQLGGVDGSIKHLGLVLATGYSFSKLLWLQQKEPENYQRIAHILLPHDYINYWLTGELRSEYGDASGTGYFDIRNRCWKPELFDLLAGGDSLRNALPPLLAADQCVGRVKPQTAALLGLSNNVWVASGGGDNMIGAIGTGNIVDGKVTVSLGTSGVVYANSTQPLQTQHPAIASFCSSHNTWLPLICTMNLTGAVNSIRALFKLSLSDFNALAATAAIGCEGVTLLPFFNGERVPDLPNSRGSLWGLSTHNIKPENLCRSVMEATTFGLRYGLDLLTAAGIDASEIRLIGGGANSPLWRQMVADIMKLPVVCPKAHEAGALGAAIQAIWCCQRAQHPGCDLHSLCQRYIRLDAHRAAQPDAASMAAYDSAYARYQQYLSQAEASAEGGKLLNP